MSGSIVDRLTLKAAGVRGNGLDDVVVRRVAQYIHSMTSASRRSLRYLKKKGLFLEDETARKLGQVLGSTGLLELSACKASAARATAIGKQCTLTGWAHVARRGRKSYDRYVFTKKGKL